MWRTKVPVFINALFKRAFEEGVEIGNKLLVGRIHAVLACHHRLLGSPVKFEGHE
jgi:hypothetical protein